MVFDAGSIEEATGICALPEFRADLNEMRQHGNSLFGRDAVFAARAATAIEIVAFKHAMSGAGPSEGLTMAFLIPVDGMVVTIIQPE